MLLNNGEVVGHSTDTVYGLIAKIDKDNIAKINNLKNRKWDTPLQVLVSSLEEGFKISKLDSFSKNYLLKNFKEKTSYIVKANEEFNDKYLLESFKGTVMFRVPTGEILELIKEVGPIFASSANKHGEEILNNKEQVSKLFGIESFGRDIKDPKASKIISLINNEIKEIRN